MSEWQPIETAPKDGTWILVFDEEINFCGVAYREYKNCWSDGHQDYLNVTHWMPLPKPPEHFYAPARKILSE